MMQFDNVRQRNENRREGKRRVDFVVALPSINLKQSAARQSNVNLRATLAARKHMERLQQKKEPDTKKTRKRRKKKNQFGFVDTTERDEVLGVKIGDAPIFVDKNHSLWRKYFGKFPILVTSLLLSPRCPLLLSVFLFLDHRGWAGGDCPLNFGGRFFRLEPKFSSEYQHKKITRSVFHSLRKTKKY